MDIQFYYAGENAQKVYEPFVPALREAFRRSTHHGKNWQWDKDRNTLRVLLATAKDVDPSERYKRYDFSVLGGCSSDSSKAGVDLGEYLKGNAQRLYQILMKSASTPNGFMYGIGFQEAVLQNPRSITDAMDNAASASSIGSETAHNISLDIQSLRSPAMIVTLKDSIESAEDSIRGYAGVEAKYFIPSLASAEGLSLFTVAHEVIGHGVSGHHGDSNGAEKYKCQEINYDVIDEIAAQEAQADISGVVTHDIAREMGVLKEDKSIAPVIESLRSVGGFFLISNRFSMANSTDANDHTTSVHFDSKKPGYKSIFAGQTGIRGFTSLPPVIVTFADMVSGYVYAHTLKERIKRKDKTLTKFERENFKNLHPTPVDSIENFSMMGELIRKGFDGDSDIGPIEKDPAWVVTSIRYLKKTGGIEVIKAMLKPELRPVVDDVVHDFLEAVDRYGSPLLKADKMPLFDKYLPKKINYWQAAGIIMDIPQIHKDKKSAQTQETGEAVPRHILLGGSGPQ